MAVKIIPNTETVPVKLDSNGRLINKDGVIVDLVKTDPNLVLIGSEGKLINKDGVVVDLVKTSPNIAFINAEGKLVNKDGEPVTSAKAGGSVDCGGAANVDGSLIDAGSASSLY